MELVAPSAVYKDSFIEAVTEFKANPDCSMEAAYYKTLSLELLASDFDAFTEEKISHARGENLPENYVPDTELWLVDQGTFIGEVRIRHYLNEHLMQIGGHIGYDIRPSKRQRGYGSTILALALPKAKELGIERVLVTCDETNLGSKKIIEKNGGVLEGREVNPETGTAKLRFWINT